MSATARPESGGGRRPAGEQSAPPRQGEDVARSAGRINEPRPALVESGFDGTPRKVNRQPVALVREEWRVVDRWWTEAPVARRYFDVVLESGQHAVAFRDEERGGWFIQRGA